MQCPCHSGKPYEVCCLPYHKDKNPPDALALMRSRYSAYALGKVDYILATTHPDHPDSKLPLAVRKKQIKQFCQNTEFKDLQILAFENTFPRTTVTFRAILTQKGQDASFTEKSEFIHVNGRWLYLSGVCN